MGRLPAAEVWSSGGSQLGEVPGLLEDILGGEAIRDIFRERFLVSGGIPLTTVGDFGEPFGSLGRELPGGSFSSF